LDVARFSEICSLLIWSRSPEPGEGGGYLIAGAAERAAWRFLEFFTVNIRDKNARTVEANDTGGHQ
jgi:hypothetical protein